MVDSVRMSLEVKHQYALFGNQSSNRQNIEDSLQGTLFLDSYFLRVATRVWEASDGSGLLGKRFRRRAIVRYVVAVCKFESLLRWVRLVGYLVFFVLNLTEF